MSAVNEQQIMPQVGQEKVLDYAFKFIPVNSDWNGIRSDLTLRAETGKTKYGTYLMSFNGRNPILDWYQEVLDAVMYTTQAYIEAENEYLLIFLAEALHNQLVLCHAIRFILTQQGVLLNG